MEEQGKRYEELNPYEQAVARAVIEQKTEAAVKALNELRLVLNFHSVHTHVDPDGMTVTIWLDENETEVTRHIVKDGDLVGIISEAIVKRDT